MATGQYRHTGAHRNRSSQYGVRETATGVNGHNDVGRVKVNTLQPGSRISHPPGEPWPRGHQGLVHSIERRRALGVDDERLGRRVVEQKHHLREEAVATAKVYHPSAPEQAPHATRCLPGLEQLLAGQAAGLAHLPSQALEQAITGKPVKIVSRQALARGSCERREMGRHQTVSHTIFGKALSMAHPTRRALAATWSAVPALNSFIHSTLSGALMSSLLRSLLLVMFVSLLPTPSWAQSTATDDAAIRARLAQYADARNQRDAHAEALCYTLDGDFRSSAGPFVFGREAVEKQLTVTNPNYRFLLTVTHVRFITPQVAIADADVNTGIGANLAPLVGVYVMLKQGNDWLISGARIARAPVPAAAPAR